MDIIDRAFNVINLIRNNLSKKQFIIFSSVLIGISVGLAAVVLKIFTHQIFLIASFYNTGNYRFFFLILPVVGILLTVLVVQKLLHGKIDKGLSHIHNSIINNSSLLPRKQMYAQIITSSLTVGLGGSAGLEAPIVVTGAAFGSNYGRTHQLNYQDRTLLLACGISAGIGAVFNAPIAGVLCALEIILLDLSIAAFTPLIIASATGALISNMILNNDIMLSFNAHLSFTYSNIVFYILLGILAGLLSVYHSHVFLKIEGLFSRSKLKPYHKALVGGTMFAAILFIFPMLFGEGYSSIKLLALEKTDKFLEASFFENYYDKELVLLTIVGVVIFLKPIATGLTLGAGGNGGNFAPSLFIGAYLGFFFSRLVNFLGISNVPVASFTLVGMAGVISGLYHAPLTAIFLIAEITGGYNLMIPLMIVSSISFAISKYFEPFPMDTIRMARQGTILTEDKDTKILTTIKAEKLIETDFKPINADATLGTLVELISKSKRNIFPVVDKDKNLLGIILLDNIREIIFKHDLYDKVFVKELMTTIPAIISCTETMDGIMKKFDETGAWNLPVVNEQHKYMGFISKSRVFSSYRSILQTTSL
jgi:chloride channel protein, CIC family